MDNGNYPQFDIAPPKNRPRLILAIIAGAILIIITVAYIINFLSSGTVVISTSGKYDISIYRIGDQTVSATATNKNKLSVKLHTGTYSATVTSKYFSSQKTFTISPHSTKNIYIALQSIGTIEPVSNQDAHDLIISASGLEYINLSNNQLTSIDNQNNAHNLSNNLTLYTVKWSSPSYGVAQDLSQNLYLVNNGTISKLSLPITVANVNYALSPSMTLYVSNGHDIYAGTPNGKYTRIFNSDQNLTIINANNNGVLVNKSTGSAAGEGDQSSQLLLITPSKTYSTSSGFYQASWSPNGNYLVATGGTQTTIYNSKLEAITNLPANNVISPVWLDNSTIFYGLQSGLWSYNLQTKTATLAANAQVYGYISEIYPSQDGAYIYMDIQLQNSSTSKIELFRLGLNNHTVSPLMQELQVFLPNTTNGCSLGYINFTKPTITVNGTDTTGQNCTQVAQSYLSQYGVDASKLNFVSGF